jgi:hypothetical protein
MSALRVVGLVLGFTLPLFAQRPSLNERQLGTYRGTEDSVRWAMSYCNAIDDSVLEQQPRIFALDKVYVAGTGRHWVQVADRDEWSALGKPAPLAFVWNRDGAIVQVTVVARPSRFRSAVSAHDRVDYCYGVDNKLIRIRAVWDVPAFCEVLFPCRLISDRDFFLLNSQGPAVTDWVFISDETINKLRNGKEVDDYFDPSNSLTVKDLHLRTSDDLPFDHLAKSK